MLLRICSQKCRGLKVEISTRHHNIFCKSCDLKRDLYFEYMLQIEIYLSGNRWNSWRWRQNFDRSPDEYILIWNIYSKYSSRLKSRDLQKNIMMWVHRAIFKQSILIQCIQYSTRYYQWQVVPRDACSSIVILNKFIRQVKTCHVLLEYEASYHLW